MILKYSLSWVNKMTQVKVSATKPDDPSSIPSTHTWEKVLSPDCPDLQHHARHAHALNKN